MDAETLYKELFDVTDKVALVTGATKGLGRELAATLALAGAAVGICSRHEDEAQAVAAEISKATRRQVIGVGADVRAPADIQRLVRRIEQELGVIEILIASAGINIRKETGALTETDWDDVMDTNVKGVFLAAQAVLPGMRQKKYGRIVVLGSMLSHISIPGRTAYAASKTALLGLTRTLALETAKDGICVNAICPGVFDTPMNVTLRQDPAKYKAFTDKIPVGRFADPRELRGLALYLCSPACSYMTGSALVIDGGWTSQ